MDREAIILQALRALTACTEADKSLTTENTVLAVVGADESFHIIEGDDLRAYLARVAEAAGGAAAGGAAAGGAAGGELPATAAPVVEPVTGRMEE
ncbi:hypothetical protein EON66_09965 [archaeon]|nr:MAG: hypothetical protein EON66_09965 [archaeon]